MDEDTKKEEGTPGAADFLLEGSAKGNENEKKRDGTRWWYLKKGPRGGAPLIWTQILAASAVAMMAFATGCSFVYPGVTLPELMDTNSTDIILDESNAALFSGLVGIGGLIGSLSGGALTVRLGQRVTILACLPFVLLSWVVLAVGPSVLFLHGARFVQGITNGICSVSVDLYVVEFASVEWRGRLGGLIDLARSLGVFFAYSVGAALSWRPLALVCGIVPIVPPLLALPFLPDSPRWLASKKHFEKAEKSLRFFRGQAIDIAPEMSDIKESVYRVNKKATVMTQMKQLRDCVLIKRFLILMFMVSIFPFIGHVCILNYLVTIFMETESGIDAYMSAILVGVARVTGGLFYFFIVDKLGRKVVLLCSTLVCAAATAGISIYFYIKTEMENEEMLFHIRALPLISLTVFVFSVSSSLQSVFLYVRELLPNAFRSMGCGIINLTVSLATFLCIQVFPIMTASLGFYGYFASGTLFGLVLAFTPLILLPETKGRSLEEIEETLRKNEGPVRKEGETVI